MSQLTKILQAIPTDPLTGSLSVPIYQTATFVQDAPGQNRGFDYARSGNPTRQALENLIAKLENGHAGFAFASGLAAIDAVLKLLRAGDEIVAVDDIYGGAYRLFTHIYEKFGIKIRYVDTSDLHATLDAITDRTRLVWLESPTNPTLKVSDIAAISNFAKKVDALTVVDNTFASPVLQNPLDLGADIVVHSATKYLAGHSDLIAGLVVTATPELSEQLKFIQNASGGILGPQDSWLCIRGIETLPLRIEQQCRSALALAHALGQFPQVDKIWYPGLQTHPNHVVAGQQMRHFGGVLSFSLKNDTVEAATEFVTSTKLFHLAESLGGVKSLVCHPASMTHKSIPRARRLAVGVQDSLIRLSCGIEGTEDLVQDVLQALLKLSLKKADSRTARPRAASSAAAVQLVE